MTEEFDDEIWELVKNSPQGVAPPWDALKEFYCRDKPSGLWHLDSLLTAIELGFIKEVGHLKWRLTIKGYKMAEKLWGPKEEACKEEKRKHSIWNIIFGEEEGEFTTPL